MTREVARILNDALLLSEDERLELAQQIIASVEGAADEDWHEQWLAELDRRLTADRGDGERGAAWEEVRARVLHTLSTS
jgi:putative addiction module component (TIGR02574 family)